jgi:hypothetical protein
MGRRTMSFENHKKYSNPTHPEHKEWLVGRRDRFYWILGSAKSSCKLLPEEKELVNELRKVIKKNTEGIK